jgi:hypothetical protein
MGNSQIILNQHAEEAVAMKRNSNHFEGLAKGVLDLCYMDSIERAKNILLMKLLHFRWVSKSRP